PVQRIVPLTFCLQSGSHYQEDISGVVQRLISGLRTGPITKELLAEGASALSRGSLVTLLL
ncbi:MAG TPA: hypothetical protein VD794_10460, partial [Flavisolibacter sp.]|nr:hypothetical protein [Flavisolibacter sp.]